MTWRNFFPKVNRKLYCWRMSEVKYIFVTGGVVSSIGKGIVSASLGCLLKKRGFKVSIQKLDPYINVDAGTMNPYQHGEVYVTDDGAETDLDLGHYERFIEESLKKDNNVTTGKIYGTVIAKERRGDYLGETVKVIPHITDQIKYEIRRAAEVSKCQISIVEIGGTIGDIEGLPFLEAIRQLRSDAGEKNVIYVHVTLVPHMAAAKELKTKPTQHSVKELRSIGIQPDIIVCRTQEPLNKEIIDKISLYCDVDKGAVIEARDVENIYEVPLIFESLGLGDEVSKRLGFKAEEPDLRKWEEIVSIMKKPRGTVKICLVGKYVELKDAYLSISEALKHGGIANKFKVDIQKIDAEELEGKEAKKILSGSSGILVPGGFGSRGIEGKLKAIEYARVNKIPYLGICYGMQWAVVEYARNVMKWRAANSTEVDEKTPYPVIDLLPEQRNLPNLGGTMRLGSYKCRVKENSFAYKAYKKTIIYERHRHRFEFNNVFQKDFERAGLVASGINPDRNLVEIVEIKKHPWFVAVQFHPEFKSRPGNPHPLFRDFIAAAIKSSRKQ